MIKSRNKKDKYSKKYMSKVAGLGCLICGGLANIHHIRHEGIKNDYFTIPLCKEHHQGTELSVHGTPQKFKDFCGSELKLLCKTIEEVFKND